MRLHAILRWALEVPLPATGDQRAWDAMVTGGNWRYGVEAETAPQDSQALSRRLELKLRDGGVNGVILLLPESRRSRAFLNAVDPAFRATFPVPPRLTLDRLGAGLDPGGSAIVVLRPAQRPVSSSVTSDDRMAGQSPLVPARVTRDG